MKKALLFTVIGLLSFISFGQTDVTGSVKDTDGTPIPGANVYFKNSTSGGTTDFDGKFSFSTALTGTQVLQVSYLGYGSVEKPVDLVGTSIAVDFVLQEGGSQLDEVVLTASATFRSQKQAPMSISSIKMAEITKLSANSQADIIISIPGITAEGGGGETATNVFVRGLPSGGQYVFNPLQYDGLPLISNFGQNSSAHDVYARPDIGMKGVEFVRGGAAVLYGAGSVAGIINYTSKTGDTNEENIINMEWAEKGRLKTDFYTGGQLGAADSNTYYAFTGFVRKDDGPIETGLPTKGVQFRGNIKQKFENGSFTVHGQMIDDKAQFFLPLPLEGGTRDRLQGNDGEDVYQLLSGELANTAFKTPGGMYKSPIEDGVYTKGGYLLTDFNYNFDDDLKFKAKAKYAKYQHSFALYVGGNGANPNPITLNEYVNNIAPGNLGYTANYVGSTQAINGSDLVVDNLSVDRIRPMTDYSGEASLTKTIEVTNGTHNITVGTYLARTETEDSNYQYRVLSEFNNNPRLVNLNYTNAAGENVVFSTGGLYNRIGQVENRTFSQDRTALYLTDEMVFDRWRFDVGFRYEETTGVVNFGNIIEEQVYDNADLTPELANVKYGDGSFTRATVNGSDWAVSLAGLYELNDNVNVYANISKGFFFPALNGFRPLATGVTNPFNPEKIIQFEAGAKYGNGKLSGSFAAYYVSLIDRIKGRGGFVNGVLVDLSRSEQDTRTIGIEANWDYRLTNDFSFIGSLTYQDHEITKNTDEDFTTGEIKEIWVGNKLGRQPNFLGTIGFNYDNKRFDALISSNYTGKKFASDNNTIELDGINIMRIGAGYTMNLNEKNNDNLRLGFSVYNLLDDNTVTEGDPRAVDQTEEKFFFGRPILPRRVFITATFNF